MIAAVKPVLADARSEVECLSGLCRRFGTPDEVSWPGVSALPFYSPWFPIWPSTRPSAAACPTYNPESTAGLLDGLLCMCPQRRLSARDALLLCLDVSLTQDRVEGPCQDISLPTPTHLQLSSSEPGPGTVAPLEPPEGKTTTAECCTRMSSACWPDFGVEDVGSPTKWSAGPGCVWPSGVDMISCAAEGKVAYEPESSTQANIDAEGLKCFEVIGPDDLFKPEASLKKRQGPNWVAMGGNGIIDIDEMACAPFGGAEGWGRRGGEAGGLECFEVLGPENLFDSPLKKRRAPSRAPISGSVAMVGLPSGFLDLSSVA